MIYILTFEWHGKPYSNFEKVSGKYCPNQRETAACGLLLGKIDKENLSRENRYLNLCLLELDENEGVINPVWAAQEYIPNSKEVK